MASPVALSAAATATSGEGGSARATAVGTAISAATPAGRVDLRGHVERKKANSARRSEIWASNMSDAHIWVVRVVIPPESHRISLRAANHVHVRATGRRSRHRDACVIGEEGRAVMIVVVLDVREIRTPDL